MATHSEVAHRWAQDDLDGRLLTADRMFVERSTAYSGLFQDGSTESTIFSHGWHWPLAAFQTTQAGERVVLVNAERYSVSTGKHLGHVRGALGGYGTPRTARGLRVFYVRHVSPRHAPGGAGDFHTANIEYLTEKASEFYNAAAKRKKAEYRAYDLQRADEYFNQAKEYAEAFGLPPLAGTLDEMAAAVAAQARETAAAAARYEAEHAARRAEQLKEARALALPGRELWLAGGSYQCPGVYQRDEAGSVYVRRHGEDLQTSMGASVPWKHALLAYARARLCRRTGEEWVRNGHSIRVGAFQVDRITAEGDLHAGCHMISWARMKELAEREGVA